MKATSKNKLICNFCKQKYSKISNLKQHKKNVHFGRAFVCPICKEQQSSKYSHHRHIDRHHPGVEIENIDENESVAKNNEVKLSEKAKDKVIARLTEENDDLRGSECDGRSAHCKCIVKSSAKIIYSRQIWIRCRFE